MNFITVAELNFDIINNLYKIPKEIDIVVGIPRSGMLVATLIALYLNKPLVDIDAYIRQNVYMLGNTKNNKSNISSFKEIKKALIVEDSSNTGRSIKEAKDKIENNDKIQKYYLAAYVTKESKNGVDIFFKEVNSPRVFEWNFMHHQYLINACIDIDGVLCLDPTKEENDDGERYLEFILNAKPKYIPTQKVGWIVTSRLEKYRPQTEEWLRKQGVEFNELIMLNGVTAEERQKLGSHGKFKGEVFKNLKRANWFIESDSNQAKEIACISGKDVFCVNNQHFYSASLKIQFIKRIKRYLKDITRFIMPLKVRRAMKRFKGN